MASIKEISFNNQSRAVTLICQSWMNSRIQHIQGGCGGSNLNEERKIISKDEHLFKCLSHPCHAHWIMLQRAGIPLLR